MILSGGLTLEVRGTCPEGRIRAVWVSDLYTVADLRYSTCVFSRKNVGPALYDSSFEVSFRLLSRSDVMLEPLGKSFAPLRHPDSRDVVSVMCLELRFRRLLSWRVPLRLIKEEE